MGENFVSATPLTPQCLNGSDTGSIILEQAEWEQVLHSQIFRSVILTGRSRRRVLSRKRARDLGSSRTLVNAFAMADSGSFLPHTKPTQPPQGGTLLNAAKMDFER